VRVSFQKMSFIPMSKFYSKAIFRKPDLLPSSIFQRSWPGKRFYGKPSNSEYLALRGGPGSPSSHSKMKSEQASERFLEL
jgi:hypothetical protein